MFPSVRAWRRTCLQFVESLTIYNFLLFFSKYTFKSFLLYKPKYDIGFDEPGHRNVYVDNAHHKKLFLVVKNNLSVLPDGSYSDLGELVSVIIQCQHHL